jgi:hypothetical protein
VLVDAQILHRLLVWALVLQSLAQARQSCAERLLALGSILRRPEERGELLPRVGAAFDRQIDQDGQSFARRKGDRPSIKRYNRGSKASQSEMTQVAPLVTLLARCPAMLQTLAMSMIIPQARRSGRMVIIALAAPIRPGKHEAWRRFIQEIQGLRYDQY